MDAVFREVVELRHQSPAHKTESLNCMVGMSPQNKCKQDIMAVALGTPG